MGDPSSVETNVYPEDYREVERWITWKETDQGRKVPRAPYAHSKWPDRFVNAQNPEVWTDFPTARGWAEKLPGHGVALVIRDRQEYPDEELVLLDYDDVRDPKSGEIHPVVREHLQQAESYGDVSVSGRGVHLLCRGVLPEGVKTVADKLPGVERFPDAKIEIYDTARFIAMSGTHLEQTPTRITEAQRFLDNIIEQFASVVEGTPDALMAEPTHSKAELAEIDVTTDIRDIFDAIQQIDPGEIRLRSTVTEERSDGTKSLDPSWANSESGTRLAEIDDGWIYREGMIGLDALQVVALEEGIIRDERTYPSDGAFWDAVEALRDRGAHIPKFETVRTRPDSTDIDARPSRPTKRVDEDSDAIEEEIEMLRETVRNQRERIDELESALEESDRVIEEQREELRRLRTELDAARYDDG